MRPAFLLDSSVCVQILRCRASFIGLPDPAQLAISVIVAAELWAGVEKSGNALHLTRLEALFEMLPLMEFAPSAARHYGEIRANLAARGTPIGPMDLLIAAHARSLDATLITGNVGEFQRVEGLKVLLWQ